MIGDALLLILAVIAGAMSAAGLVVLALAPLVDRLIDETFRDIGD